MTSRSLDGRLGAGTPSGIRGTSPSGVQGSGLSSAPTLPSPVPSHASIGSSRQLISSAPRSSGTRFLQSVVGTGESPKDEAKYVPVEEMKSEREKWMQMCMHEVWNLENAAFEKINSQIEEATRRLQTEVTQAVLQKVEDERSERAAAVAELRRELRSPISTIEADLSIIRADITELKVSGGGNAPSESTIRAREAAVASVRAQASATDAALADLRSELASLKEQYELQAASAQSDLRHELSAMQLSQVQAVHEAAARSSGDLMRHLQEVSASSDAGRSLLKAEFKQEIDKFRQEVEERLQGEDQAVMAAKASAAQEFHMRLDELARGLQEAKQDSLSETTVLRGRVEVAVGERQDELSKMDSLQLMIREEQGRRSADHVSMQTRIEVLERRATTAETMPTTAVVDHDALSRMQALETMLRETQEDAGARAAQVSQLQRQIASTATLPSSLTARMDSMAADLATLWEKASTAAAAAAAAPRPVTIREGSPVLVQKEMEALRAEVTKLSQDLLDERRDRCRALTDVNRITEDVARAAAATIERAEKRFADEHHATSRGPTAPSTRATSIERRAGSVSRGGAGGDTPQEGAGSDDIRGAMGSGFARLVGEMDAELRVELTSRIRLLTAELKGEIMRDVAIRVSSTETSLSAQMGEVSMRMGKLEAFQLGSRVSSLESEVKRHSLMIASAAHESRRRASSTEATRELRELSSNRNSPYTQGGDPENTYTNTTDLATGPGSVCSGPPSEPSTHSASAPSGAANPSASLAAGGVAAIEHALASSGSQLPAGLKASLEGLVSALDRSMVNRVKSGIGPLGSDKLAATSASATSSLARGDPGGVHAAVTDSARSPSSAGAAKGISRSVDPGARSQDPVQWGSLNDRASALGSTYRDNALRGRSTAQSPGRATSQQQGQGSQAQQGAPGRSRAGTQQGLPAQQGGSTSIQPGSGKPSAGPPQSATTPQPLGASTSQLQQRGTVQAGASSMGHHVMQGQVSRPSVGQTHYVTPGAAGGGQQTRSPVMMSSASAGQQRVASPVAVPGGAGASRPGITWSAQRQPGNR